MRTGWILALLVALMAAGRGGASDAPAPPDAAGRFARAAEAYNRGEFRAAIADYEGLVTAGHASPEVFFNLGNAWYRLGDQGRAVLNYRRAWLLEPRDGQIRANLRFAMEKAGAPALDGPLPELILTRLTAAEWSAVACAALWIGIGCLCVALFRAAARPLLRRVAAVCGLVLLGALAGVVRTDAFRRNPEAVVLAPGQQALFAPIDGSTPHFALPPGSVVRVAESSGPWIKVLSGRDAGWIRRDAVTRVHPWS